MFDYNSRYYDIEAADYISREGKKIRYKRRRFLPKRNELPLLMEVTVTQGDRLDLIAARALENPEHFWRICDANESMNPFSLTEEIGCVLRVPIPRI
jgi:hypothetical protein